MCVKQGQKIVLSVFFAILAIIVFPVFFGQAAMASWPAIQKPGIPERSAGSEMLAESTEGVTAGPVQEAGPETKMSGSQSASIDATFEGFNFDDNSTENGGFVFIPPDPIGAAGLDQVIAVVNTMIEARDKSGNLIFRDALQDFFGPLTPVNATFDPKVIYDHYEDRFVVVTLERLFAGSNPSMTNRSRILLAVSKTSSPATSTASDWYFHAIESKILINDIELWADYPGFEVDEEAIYITSNMFEFPGGPDTNFGVRLWIVDKGIVEGFYAGGSASVNIYDPYNAGAYGYEETTMPCQVYGASGVAPGVGTFLVTYSGLTDGELGGDEFIGVIRVDNPLVTPSFVYEQVNIGNIEDIGGSLDWPDLLDAPQLGTMDLIEVNDRRALDCVWRDNSIWLTTTINPNSGPDTGQTTAHWIKLDTSSVTSSGSPAGLISLNDQGDIGGEDIATETCTFFPSVAVNSSGDAKFGFSASASTIYAGAYVAGRQAGDPAGTVQASITVHAGQDYYYRTLGGSRNRWGDYSGISVDPADDSIFWVFNQYAALRGTELGGEDGRWGTAWVSCSFDAPSPTIVNHLVSLNNVSVALNPSEPNAPAGVFVITATFENISQSPINNPFFQVETLTGGNLLLNADGGPGGADAALSLNLGDGVWDPGEVVIVNFDIGLQTLNRFTFLVDLLGTL